jgi:FKBP-type peptidyl-prolyl cis-trans isomerase FkpA
MKKQIAVIILICTMLAMACQESATGKKNAAISGYEYEVFKAGAGEKVEVGDYVYFQMDMMDDKGEILQTYRNQKVLPSVKVAGAEEAVRKQNPIIDVISHLTVGDSAIITIPADSIPGLPPEYAEVENFNYAVIINERLDEAAYKERIAEQQAELQEVMMAVKARKPEVVALVDQTIKDFNSGKLNVEETPSGLQYYIHELGTGDMPSNGGMLTMQYYGALTANGAEFDNSFDRGRGIPFRVGTGSVIAGWDEAALLLPVGTKASLFIPSELGYGEQGSGPDIGPNADLYFYVEAEEFFF